MQGSQLEHESNDPDNRRIIEAINKGDEAEFQKLYLGHSESLIRFAFSYVKDSYIAEEVVHDVFLNLWMNRESWTPLQGINPYLFGAVRNRALNIIRARGISSIKAPQLIDLISESPMPDYAVLNSELNEVVNRAISSLPERAREAIVLRWVHSMSHAQVARVLNISEDAARMISTRAAVQLREILKEFK